MSLVQITNLCGNGRFGNQLFQYVFAKGFAQRHNAVLQIPENWIGRKIFEIPESPISISYPQEFTDNIPHRIPNDGTVNLNGYFQNQEAIDYYSVTDILSWLKFRPWVLDRFPKPDKSYLAAHIRRGDYVKLQHLYCLPTYESYLSLISTQFFDMECKWISEEKPEVDQDLAKQGLDFLPDFMTLYHAKVLLRSNSTFSWWAAALSGNEVYSPIVEDRVGIQDVRFTRGNHPKMASSKYHPIFLTDLYLKIH